MEPALWMWTSLLMTSGLTFGWYYWDSEAHHYKRSKLLNISIVAVSVIAIPYYVVRRSEPGTKFRAFGAVMGLFLLLVLLYAGAMHVGTNISQWTS